MHQTCLVPINLSYPNSNVLNIGKSPVISIRQLTAMGRQSKLYLLSSNPPTSHGQLNQINFYIYLDPQGMSLPLVQNYKQNSCGNYDCFTNLCIV